MRIFALGLCVCAISACNGGDYESGSETDTALRGLIRAHALSGDPSEGHDLPSIDDPVAVLGRKLFFSKSLGGDRDSACVSCHHPVLGGGDGLALSIGVGADNPDLLGPGRTHPDGDFTVPRNAPTTFNLAFWEKGLFWDSRVENLEGGGIRTPDTDYGSADPEAGDTISAAQTRFPVTSAEEMRGFVFVLDDTNAEVRSALEARLTDDGNWASEFNTAFGSPEITYGRIAEAIAAYEDSQVFTNTAWRAYVKGDNDAIGESAKRGALLFFRGTEDQPSAARSCFFGAPKMAAPTARPATRGTSSPTRTFTRSARRRSGEAKATGPQAPMTSGARARQPTATSVSPFAPLLS
jgi:cytochrome c peroxidase